MPDNPLTVEDFAMRIKATNPDYAEVDDYDLAHRIIKKYPDYAPTVKFGPRERAYAAAARASIGRDVADDFLNVIGGIESGNAHRWKNGKVKESPRDPKDGQVAVGFSQIKPGTIKKYNLDPYDEDDNIEGGLRYFAEGGSDPVARRLRYFGGPGGGVQSYRRTGKIPKGGDFTGTSYGKYVRATMPKNSPRGDTPRYGVQPNSSFEQAPISGIAQPVTAEDLPPKVSNNAPVIPENIPPEMIADPAATRPRLASAPTPEDAPMGHLGEVRAKGPQYEAKFYDFVHRNAQGTKGATAGKAADDNLAKVFLQITDFLEKNPKASPKDVNRGFAQIGAEFLKDSATKGSQLPRALHEAMLSEKYTAEEWNIIPRKLQQQIKQAAAERSAQKAQQVAQQKFARFAKGRDVAADIQWHFGSEGLERFDQLKKRDQQEMISLALTAAFKDEAKKAGGTELTQSASYQAEMRGRIPALKALEGQPPPGASSDPFGLLKSINAQPFNVTAPVDARAELKRRAGEGDEAEYRNFLLMNRAADSPSMRNSFAELRVKQQVEPFGGNADQALAAQDEEAARKERVAKMGYFTNADGSPGGKVGQIPASVFGGLASAGGEILKTTAMIGQVGAGRFIFNEASDNPLYKLGASIEKKVPELLGTNPDLEKEMAWGKLPAGAGNMVVFLAGGVASKGSKIAIGLIGAGMEAPVIYEEIKAGGGSENEALGWGLLGGGILGSTEIIGFTGALNYLKGSAGEVFLRAVAKKSLKAKTAAVGRDTLLNAFQEGVQAYGEGVFSGKPRSAKEIKEAGFLGAVLGGGTTAVVTAATSINPPRETKTETTKKPATKTPAQAEAKIDQPTAGAAPLRAERAASTPTRLDAMRDLTAKGETNITTDKITARQREIEAEQKLGEAGKELAGQPAEMERQPVESIPSKESGQESKVLAHVAGPSGSGKTELVNKLGESVKNIDLVDLDIFDEQAVRSFGWEDRPKDNYTDKMLDQLHEKRQALVDAYIAKSDKPIIFFGHHIEGENITDLPAEDHYLLNVSPAKAAMNASRRPGKSAAQVREDVQVAKRDVTQLKALGYESQSSRAVFAKIQQISEEISSPARPLTPTAKGETITPEKADAETTQSAAVPEPRRPTRPTVAGAETQISIPDSAEKYPARYTVREAEDVEASHEAQGFNPNPNYHYRNDRSYESNSEYRMRVMERSGAKFDAREVVNTSPTLDTGPPAWDAEGNALGGNSRVMILKRVYESNPEGAAQYKEEVMRQASLLGLDVEAIAKMERPILGRELVDEKIDYQKAISNLNRPSAAPLTSDELSASQAKQLRPEIADYIARKIEDTGESATVASMMDAHGADIINRMVDEGLISAPERNTLLKDGKATPEAKKRIERLLTASVYRDGKHMEDTPPSVRANVERIAPAMMRVAETEWDVKPLVQEALDAIQEAKATGTSLAMMEGQPSFGREPYSSEAIQMAKILQMGTRKTADRFKAYVDDLANFESGQGGLFGPPPTRAQSFEIHFGNSPTGDTGGSVGSRVPLNPVPPVTPPPPQVGSPRGGAVPPSPPAGPTLAEARLITRAPEPSRSAKDILKSIPSWLQTNFTSEFTPLRDLERLVRKAAGMKSSDFDMARRFETLAGAGAKAEADLIEFKREVLAPVKHIADEFNDFLFLKRAEDRLTKDPNRKRVGTWDLAKVQKGLDELKAEITSAEYAKLEQAGRVYQQHMQRALYLQVESGRMTQSLYDKIIAENDFYAPYKLLKYLEETSSSPGTGRQIASVQDVTKAITGIDVDDFGLRNLLQASAEQITRSRILAEKNQKMLALAELADVDAQSQSPTELIKHAKLTSYYPIDYKPAEEILHQLRLQDTARNPQLLEQQMVKVGKAIEFAEASGISVGQKNLPSSLGRAIIGQIKGGKISLKAFTSEVVAHEIGHVFDEATGVVRKKVFGTMRDVTQRHSSEINTQRTFQKELKTLTQYTQLGGNSKYQSSAKERYAEFISLYIHDPMKARQLAPNWTEFFEKNILPRAKVQRVVGSLADFFQKVDALPNIKSELQGLDNHNYLELAIRRAFPEKATQLGVRFGDKPGTGNEIVPYFKNGKPAGLEVSKEVAQSIQGLNAVQASVVAKLLMIGRTPLQFGATSANLGFQVVNYVSADQLRTLITSRYGLRLGLTETPIDMIRYPLDAVYAFYTSVAGNVLGKPNALFMDWMKSGAANSTIQRELTPEAFKQTLAIEKKTPAQKVRGSGRFLLDTVAKMANAVEEATKITTLKRGLRFEGADKMTPENRQKVIDERITPEVRNYGGSPDFARHGAQMRQMNLLMMFLNARVQGTTSDLTRLAGQTGGKEGAAAWGRMTVMIGLPTTLLALVNTMPGYRDDYDKVPGWEKNAYWMIPRESFFTDEETGEPVRDYYRIPKRDIFQMYANLIENGVLFARDQSPEAAGKLATDMVENLSPVNIEGDNIKERLESVIGSANPLIKMPAEIAMNRDTFRHRPIVPQYMKDASSEKQYRASTPAPYVKAGETPVAKALGISPIEIEHLARGTTGDAAGQFALRPAEAGRGDWTGYPVVRRFVRSGAVEPDIKSSEALQQAEQHQADTKIDRRRTAYEMIRQWDKAKLSPSDREGVIRETAKTDAALADDLIRYSESRILSSTERRLRLLGIENGERAQFLVDEIERTPEDKREAYVARLKALNIITKSVALQMSRIRAGKMSKGKTRSIRTRLRNFSKMERQAGRYNVTAQ